MLTGKRIAIIGAGTMGRALAGGLLRSGKVEASQLACTARTRQTAERLSTELGLHCTTDNVEAAREADVLVLCLKPKDVGKACEGLKSKGALGRPPLVVSIAAGITTARLESLLPDGTAVVRVMPNPPANAISAAATARPPSEQS